MTAVKKDENEVKEVDFVRKDTRPGIYTTDAFSKTITINGRSHYITKKEKEIKFLMNDPEIIVFDPGKKKKKKK